MTRLLVFILAVYGLAAAITTLRIGEVLRDWLASKLWPKRLADEAGYFLHCPACVGFWIGMAFSYWLYGGPVSLITGGLLPEVILDGLVACAGCWIIHVSLCKMGMRDL